MSFMHSFSGLVNKASDRLEQRLHPNATPPRIPYESKPQSGFPAQFDGPAGQQRPIVPHSHRVAYWHPHLNGPISNHFRHEQGAHGWGNHEAQNYTADPKNSFFSSSSSAVHLVAIAESRNPDPGQRYTSARLNSIATLGRERGVLSARITAPIAKGVWPAFWLLPEDPFKWPEDGEVDIFEAWDGNLINHSCLHWGYFNGPDHDKHRVVESKLGPAIHTPPGQREHVPGQGVLFEFAWQESPGGQGKMVWYIDGKPVMKASKPKGTRPLRQFRILINIAMGGDVNQGRLPADGRYEMVVSDLAMWEEREGGWAGFERDYASTREGHGN